MRQSSADSNSLKNKIINSSKHNKKRKQPSESNNNLIHTKKSFLKPSTVPIISSSVDLPIAALRAQLVDCVKSFPTTIIVGETGSGKSTQLVQYLADEFHSKGQPGCIVCTQPRRVAAVTIAQRVAAERGCVVGNEVGYSIRFEDKTSTRTKIKFVTGK
jgi:ATP-dependent RNA helicase DHX8/PRP22